MNTLSIVITNYNYALYLGAAIESALAVSWPSVEVIVVDDGSTDESRVIMSRYAGRIATVFQPNGGQNSAANAGFARAKGDAVVFLDADDLLVPEIARLAAAVWTNRVTKVQFEMELVDAGGSLLHRRWPRFRHPQAPELTAQQCRTTGYYVATPMSGNIFARSFLARVFPIPTPLTRIGGRRDRWGETPDTYLNVLAALIGDVISLPVTGAHYRIHDTNWSGVGRGWSAGQMERCQEDVDRSGHVAGVLQSLELEAPTVDALLAHESFSRRRLACLRVAPSLYPYADRRLSTALGHYLRAAWHAEGTCWQRTLMLGWALAVSASPRCLLSAVIGTRRYE